MHGLGLVELPKFCVPYNISATAEASDFKFVVQLGFAKDHHKITCRRKSGRGCGLGEFSKFGGSLSIFTQWLKLATSNLVDGLGLPRPIIKSHTRKSGCGLSLGELPKISGFPYNISTTAEASSFKIGTWLGFAKSHHTIPHRRKKWTWLGARGAPQNFGVSL